MEHKSKIERLKELLQQPLPGMAAQERMAGRVLPMPDEIPANARPSAVLCLLFPKNDILQLLLIRRTADGRPHSGQIGFPGGSMDPTDTDLRATALREANEEVGIMSGEVEILGALTALYIPVSNFRVFPYVAYAKEPPVYNISHYEVAHTLEIPMLEFMIPERRIITDVISPARPEKIRNVPAYQLEDGTIIWGATAMIISELEMLMQGL
ncbi:MAG: CoA pyrophosphatase [Bacteroidota bacterium]